MTKANDIRRCLRDLRQQRAALLAASRIGAQSDVKSFEAEHHSIDLAIAAFLVDLAACPIEVGDWVLVTTGAMGQKLMLAKATDLDRNGHFGVRRYNRSKNRLNQTALTRKASRLVQAEEYIVSNDCR